MGLPRPRGIFVQYNKHMQRGAVTLPHAEITQQCAEGLCQRRNHVWKQYEYAGAADRKGAFEPGQIKKQQATLIGGNEGKNLPMYQ